MYNTVHTVYVEIRDSATDKLSVNNIWRHTDKLQVRKSTTVILVLLSTPQIFVPMFSFYCTLPPGIKGR